jgi:hypothetical protein
MRDPELAMLMLRHRSEERGHDHGFFEDIAHWMRRSLNLAEP